MAEDLMRYDLLTQEAMRGVVRRALQRVKKSGLPGEHHFYISFDTRHAGVTISERLRKDHAENMTVVLQHQFWNLAVDSNGFEVELTFNNIPERLVVPFAAIRSFFDPHAQFALQFETVEPPVEKAAEPAPPKPDLLVAAGAGRAAEATTAQDEKVVVLDQFRKK
jgi:hypothetical protein